MKDTKWSRIYFNVFWLRRLLWVWLTIPLWFLPLYVKIVAFIVINVTVTIYILVVRPIQSLKDCIVEIINETIFAFFVISLNYLNSRSHYTDLSSKIVIYWLLSWTIITTLINICALFVIVVKGIIKYLNGRKLDKVEPVELKDEGTSISQSNTVDDRSYARYSNTEVSNAQISPQVVGAEMVSVNQAKRETDIFQKHSQNGALSHIIHNRKRYK